MCVKKSSLLHRLVARYSSCNARRILRKFYDACENQAGRCRTSSFGRRKRPPCRFPVNSGNIIRSSHMRRKAIKRVCSIACGFLRHCPPITRRKKDKQKICLVHGSFFETISAKELIRQSFKQVLDENLAGKMSPMKSGRNQRKFSPIRTISAARELWIRLRSNCGSGL
jgi:hypothetical protein